MMDPNVTLVRMIECVEWEEDREDGEAYDIIENAGQMASHFRALHGWIKHGGFLPAAWSHFREDDSTVHAVLVLGTGGQLLLFRDPVQAEQYARLRNGGSGTIEAKIIGVEDGRRLIEEMGAE